MWRVRLAMLALIGGAIGLHSFLMADIPNSPEGMLMFHGSAAGLDLLLLFCARFFLQPEMSTDIEVLFFLSILVNFFGWLAYIAYATPIYYDSSMWALTVLTAARLLTKGGHGDGFTCGPWFGVVHSWRTGRGKQNFGGVD